LPGDGGGGEKKSVSETTKQNKGDNVPSEDSGAEVVYGETSGLYPQQKQKGSIYDSKTWDQDSDQQLQDARSDIADVSERNDNVRSGRPEGDNSIEQKAWNDSKTAADKAKTFNLSSDVKHFFMRQEGVGPQKPPWALNVTPYKTYGPFKNVGGGSVPKGDKTYIDFYQGIR
jgi:hypothetical protein